MSKTKEDLVNQPSHYTQGSIECKDAMIAAFGKEKYETFCKLNAFKYLWRSDHKGNSTQDIAKAKWYMAQIDTTPTSVVKYPRRGNEFDVDL
jgi:hypothetical protein|tara:strand:- start:5375 stop:5650 length:276 start_codon:yes stop_codon:yes gene_type:complete